MKDQAYCFPTLRPDGKRKAEHLVPLSPTPPPILPSPTTPDALPYTVVHNGIIGRRNMIMLTSVWYMGKRLSACVYAGGATASVAGLPSPSGLTVWYMGMGVTR
ncbi:hypothetical protein GCM10023186_41420 [Hymenobacter koreensis]|uniref:Uncharacterized protein n=1 Tax=Hymenobacter koreensis TaxID=1084523 RepID=A0ABP8JJV6_9BACT